MWNRDKRNIQIILKDALKCTVRVRRLSDGEILEHLISNFCVEYEPPIDVDDHNYARRPDRPGSSEIEPTVPQISKTPSPSLLEVGSISSTSSSTSSPTSSFDERSSIASSPTRSPSTSPNTSPTLPSSAKIAIPHPTPIQLQSSPISDSSSTVHSDSFSVSDLESDDASDEIYPLVNGQSTAYPILFDKINSDPMRVNNSEVSTVNEDENIPNVDSGIGEMNFEESNNMDAVNNQNSHEDDEDFDFLHRIHDVLENMPNNEETSANRDENGKVWSSNYIFSDVCLKYLRGDCYNPYCDYAHELPMPANVEHHLKTASRHHIEEAQSQLLLRYDMLMEAFFDVFCKYFGRNWKQHRDKLRLAIRIVMSRPSAEAYMKSILNGFLISGMNYSLCIQQLLVEVGGELNSEEQFNVLWDLIIDTRNDKVVDQLKLFHTVLHDGSPAIVRPINKLLKSQINSDFAVPREYSINLLAKCSALTFRQIDANLLKRFIEDVKSCNLGIIKVLQQRVKQFRTDI